jgi:hypothetical protein
MKSLGFLSQIFTSIVAVAIAFLYVQPTVEMIGQIQNDISEYQNESKKIELINNTLAEHVATIESISRADKDLLATYMPPFLDDVAVLRDIEFITESVGLEYNELTYDGEVGGIVQQFNVDTPVVDSALGDLAATAHTFSVGTTGSYDELKNLLIAFEQNNYPLEVHSLEIAASDETNDLSATFGLTTYVDDVVLIGNDN